ncbi:MAG TPA: hypothetical protein VND70_08895 [Acidimicrobiales bacterium]|nr:hypothetical protein [Acidimicrobiales bacterium]
MSFFLPLPTELVDASDVVEIACAVRLGAPDRWAGIAAAAVLVIIWAANLQDAIAVQHGHHLTAMVFDWIRFPLARSARLVALQSGRSLLG